MRTKVWTIVERVENEKDLRRQIDWWQSCGVDGVFATDHLFVSSSASSGGDRTVVDADSPRPMDAAVLLGTTGALAPTLELGTIVANISLQHPIFMLRHFAQLAALHGGERIYAGLGAGWNPEEFEAIGEAMPPHQQRVQRLEDSARLARLLFDTGIASFQGHVLEIDRLPLFPRPETPPRLLLGGGSDPLLEVAGRYADHLDLNGSSARQKLGRVAPADVDRVRRLTTTISDLETSEKAVREAAQEAKRTTDVTFSVLIDTVEFCEPEQVEEREEQLRQSRQLSIPGISRVDTVDIPQCPYVLVGDVARMRELFEERKERLNLSAVFVRDGPHLPRLVSEVLHR
jgi:alkanesulfonate monooxygenase SsuD/methylene tetrahydromethanopterin reductase-like flavin-dependent oxidoreductase (luciferase family)